MEPQSLDLGACHLRRESRPAVQVHTAETHRPSRSGMPSREGRTTTEEGSAGEVCGASANVRPEQGFGIKARMQRATPPTCPAAESATAQPRMLAPRRACVWAFQKTRPMAALHGLGRISLHDAFRGAHPSSHRHRSSTRRAGQGPQGSGRPRQTRRIHLISRTSFCSLPATVALRTAPPRAVSDKGRGHRIASPAMLLASQLQFSYAVCPVSLSSQPSDRSQMLSHRLSTAISDGLSEMGCCDTWSWSLVSV